MKKRLPFILRKAHGIALCARTVLKNERGSGYIDLAVIS